MSNQDNNNRVYEQENQNPDYARKWDHDNIKVYKERVYDRISTLLIQQFQDLKDVTQKDLNELQKTFKDGVLKTGKKDSDMMVVYQSDVDANADDKKIENAILNWLNFEDPSQLDIIIEDNPSNLVLKLPDRTFDMNQKLSVLGIDSINIKDNVSQFLQIKKTKTNINRAKLSEYIDTEFSELTPFTFTHLLERFTALKNQIPFYRYRTDDFWEEYGTKNVPVEYRIEKFFEEFERIKNDIPAGGLLGISSMDILPEISEDELFGYGTMTYLIKEARMTIGDGDVLEYSTYDVLEFLNKIKNLTSDKDSLNSDLTRESQERSKLDELLREFGAFELQAKANTADSSITEIAQKVADLEDEKAALQNDLNNTQTDLGEAIRQRDMYQRAYVGMSSEFSTLPRQSYDIDDDGYLTTLDYDAWVERDSKLEAAGRRLTSSVVVDGVTKKASRMTKNIGNILAPMSPTKGIQNRIMAERTDPGSTSGDLDIHRIIDMNYVGDWAGGYDPTSDGPGGGMFQTGGSIRRVRTNPVPSNRTTTFTVNGSTKEEVIENLATRMNVPIEQLPSTLNDYLRDVEIGGDVEAWWNCTSCGQGDQPGLCWSSADTCCRGSVNYDFQTGQMSSWSIKCTKMLPIESLIY